jgi:hypothetical protein
MDVRVLQECVESNIGDLTFEVSLLHPSCMIRDSDSYWPIEFNTSPLINILQ